MSDGIAELKKAARDLKDYCGQIIDLIESSMLQISAANITIEGLRADFIQEIRSTRINLKSDIANIFRKIGRLEDSSRRLEGSSEALSRKPLGWRVKLGVLREMLRELREKLRGLRKELREWREKLIL